MEFEDCWDFVIGLTCLMNFLIVIRTISTFICLIAKIRAS